MHRPTLLPLLLLLSACVAMALSACTKPETPATQGATAEAAPRTEAETPEQAAKRLYLASREGGFGTQANTMAPTLRALVERDNTCAAEQGVCGIDSDPWLTGGGQEGGIEGAPRFTVIATDPLQARARMDYTYAWGETNKEAQTTCVVLARDATDAPWLLADLLRNCDDASSLLAMLRQAHAGPATP